MKTILHTANSRGHANHGWLDSRHTFSFADYFNAERIHFGALRVLNDDTVAPSMGFGTHPHNNMEIISIPLEGDLEHKDSMGTISVIQQGDIQVMSAGTGVTHSEKNRNNDQEVKFLQIWVIPNKQNVTPRYNQISIANLIKENELTQILSPNEHDQGVWIQQEAWFSMGSFSKHTHTQYHLNGNNHGVYAFVLKGEITIEDQQLNTRDGYALWEINEINISANEGSQLLLMEVPMIELG
ncbi:MAG: pirin family protein [Cyclobacteriaceae bacterium]|nr:pirin family protein [Cyclobacteriaceae bacterium]